MDLVVTAMTPSTILDRVGVGDPSHVGSAGGVSVDVVALQPRTGTANSI